MPETGPGVTPVTLIAANEEYPFPMAAGVRGFDIQARGDVDVRMAFVEGATKDNYWTIKSGHTYYKDSPMQNKPFTLYLRSATAGTVVELLLWGDK